jgi:hypothetical protein
MLDAEAVLEKDFFDSTKFLEMRLFYYLGLKSYLT